jgi:uncharacterized protein YqgV (UPF0045/DUF77 family)
MFIGCQFSLYPMTDRFVEVILSAIEGIQEHEDLRVETDDLSTLLIGAPETLFATVEECFLRAAATPGHLVLTATFSRGCPGEPDDPICHPAKKGETAIGRIPDPRKIEPVGLKVAAQFALYPLGTPDYMETIYREIEATKAAGVFGRSKHFCTRLDGDARQVFAVLYAAFERAGNDVGHVVITATISKGSPTQV